MDSEPIHVVVTCRNAAPWVGCCIESLRAQTRRHFTCVIVDDASSDGTEEEIRRAVAADTRFRLLALPQRVWPLHARMIGLTELAQPQVHEIVVLLDGDDWLYDETVLAVIQAAHHERRLLVTYGSHVRTDGTPAGNRPYPLRVQITGAFRKAPWCAVPVRAFRFGLWEHVPEEALRDSQGRLYRTATDRALFLPLLELAGTRSGFISKPLYVYNRETPFNEDKVYPGIPQEVAEEIHAKVPCRPLSKAQAARLLATVPEWTGHGHLDRTGQSPESASRPLTTPVAAGAATDGDFDVATSGCTTRLRR